MGRKAISGKRKTERPLRIRLDEDERKAVEAAADAAKLPVSTWARENLLRLAVELTRPSPRPKSPPPARGKGKG